MFGGFAADKTILWIVLNSERPERKRRAACSAAPPPTKRSGGPFRVSNARSASEGQMRSANPPAPYSSITSTSAPNSAVAISATRP
jgi:hypothetical protein